MLFDIENGINIWDLAEADSEAQHQFFDELLNFASGLTFLPTTECAAQYLFNAQAYGFPIYK